jgi:hypothetical protein
MQLRILRTESKGMLGGLSFEYNIRIVVDPQEQALIQKYKADREVIYQMERNVLGHKWEVSFTFGDFLKGKVVKNKNIAELIVLEDSIVRACEGLKTALHALSKIGQEEVIDI